MPSLSFGFAVPCGRLPAPRPRTPFFTLLLLTMHRIFGRGKPKVEAPTAEPIDIGETMKRLDERVPELDARIATCDADLAKMKAEYQQTRSPQMQSSIKQRMMNTLRRKQMLVQQRDTVQQRSFGLEQTRMAMQSAMDAKVSWRAGGRSAACTKRNV